MADRPYSVSWGTGSPLIVRDVKGLVWSWSIIGIIDELNKLAAAVQDAAKLLSDIMQNKVNAEDEAEKWLRAHAPDVLKEAYIQSDAQSQTNS